MSERSDRDKPIINSLLDVDWYKITMLQWIWKYFPDLKVKFAFKNRTMSICLPDFIDIDALANQFGHVCSLCFAPYEVDFIGKNLPHVEPGFLEYLTDLRLPDCEISVRGGQYYIEVEGRWSEVTLWETIVLAIVNEMYFNSLSLANWGEGDYRLSEKIRILKMNPGIQFIEFGTRRRRSGPWQRHVTQRLAIEVPTQLLGTSNVLLAKDLGIKPGGTIAHEPTMALYGYYYENPMRSQIKVLELWWEMYGHPLSIALTDTYTTDFFFHYFWYNGYAENWRGVRQDSGDPLNFTDKAVAFYKNRGIDPQGKTIVFSDGLDIEKIVALENHCRGRITTTFGWGTNLTNDLGFQPLSLVMKVIESNGHPVVKLSDNPEKASGDPAEVERCKRLIGYDPTRYHAETCQY